MSFPPVRARARLLDAELEVGLFHVVGKDHDRLAALQLEHGRLQRIDLAVRAELDAAVEGHGVGRCDRVAHLDRVEGAGLLDRQLQDGAGGGRRASI